MIELTRDLGGSIEQVSTSKYLHKTMDNVFARLMSNETTKTTDDKPIRRHKK